MKTPLYKAYLALIVVCFFWGTTYLAIKIGVQHVPGFSMAGIRNALGGVLTCAYFVVRGTKIPSKEVLWVLFIRSILLLVVGQAFVHYAEEFVPSGLAAIIAAIVPLWIAIISITIFKSTRLNRKIGAGLLLGFSGILIIFSDNITDLSNPKYLLGIFMVLLATIGWSVGSVYSGFKKIEIQPVFGAGIQMLMAGIMSLMIGVGIGEEVQWLNMHLDGILSILYLTFVGSILTYNAYLYALSKLPPTQVSIYAYVNPVVAVILGWLILNEKLNVSVVLGMSVTLIGVYLVNRGFTNSTKKDTANEKNQSPKPVAEKEIVE